MINKKIEPMGHLSEFVIFPIQQGNLKLLIINQDYE